MKYGPIQVLNADYPDLIWRINPDTADSTDEHGTMCHENGVQYPADYEAIEVNELCELTKRLESGLPSKSAVDAKIKNYNENVEPQRILREQRDALIAETDWWAGADHTLTDAQKAYRKALRDLPANSSPTLDADGQGIENVTWPTKP
jgi:hypothetical protein